MVRQKIDVHHRRIRQVGHIAYAGHWRHQRPARRASPPTGMPPRDRERARDGSDELRCFTWLYGDVRPKT
jgi:hypothetical protein